MRLYATALTAVLAGTLLLTAGEIAEAYLKAGPNVMPGGHHRLRSDASLPLDNFTTPTGAYSFRKLKSTYSGSALRLRRASDNAEQDIGFLGFVPGLGAPFDVAAANAFCAATSCFVRTWYDQSGNVRDLVQTTAASQPSLIFNCQGSLPCARTPSAGTPPQIVSGGSFAAVSPVSLSAVSRRPLLGGGSSACRWIEQSSGTGNRFATFAAGWYLATASSFAAVPQPVDNVWHSQQGVIDGASSVLSIDGVDTTGTLTVVVAAGPITIGSGGTTGTTCDFAEGIMWSGYALTPAERAVLTNNQRSFWGF